MMGSSTESREGRGSLSNIKAESSSRKFQHFGCLFSNSRIVPGSVNRPVWKMAVHLSRSLNKDKDDHDGEETLRKEGEFMNSAWNFLKIFYGLFRFFSFLNFQWPIENFMKSRTIFSNRMGKITIQCSERKRGQIKEFHRRCSVRGGNFYTNGKFLWQSFSLLPPVKSRQLSTGREETNGSKNVVDQIYIPQDPLFNFASIPLLYFDNMWYL